MAEVIGLLSAQKFLNVVLGMTILKPEYSDKQFIAFINFSHVQCLEKKNPPPPTRFSYKCILATKQLKKIRILCSGDILPFLVQCQVPVILYVASVCLRSLYTKL